MAGTEAWPSETWLTPGTVSSACIRFSGARCVICRDESSVIPAAGVVVTLGAAPDDRQRLVAKRIDGELDLPVCPFDGNRADDLAGRQHEMTWNGVPVAATR